MQFDESRSTGSSGSSSSSGATKAGLKKRWIHDPNNAICVGALLKDIFLRHVSSLTAQCLIRVRFIAMFTSYQLLELMAQIMGAFQENFYKVPPWKATLLDWERRAFGFGSIKDRSGRKNTREETCAGVAASIEQFPIKSTLKRAAELGIPRATMRDHMKIDLKVRP
ncbi:hypothetical protein C0J52_11957 [Blattella germanica]|nr:hypothetical protein C0J52_11957 [Blattella germanica]